MTGGELLGQALGYAGRGWPVFPCCPDNPACTKPKCHECKAPAIPSAHPAASACKGECGRDGHGFHDATTDPGRIRAWWRRWPRANVAIATGAPGPDVLDVDRKADGDGFAAFGRLRRAGMLTGAAMLVRTRSGGVHLYFTGTSQRGPRPRHSTGPRRNRCSTRRGSPGPHRPGRGVAVNCQRPSGGRWPIPPTTARGRCTA